MGHEEISLAIQGGNPYDMCLNGTFYYELDKELRLRVNREIRVPKVRLISQTGEQVGVLSTYEAMKLAEEANMDLVEIVSTSNPPVCKIMDYGKFRYDQTKRAKESKKATHQIKVKEVKLKPNIDENDLQTKLRHAKEFITKGFKVKVTLMFRGREMEHTQIGHKLVERFCADMEEIATPESTAQQMGRILTVVLAPGAKKKKNDNA